MLSQFLKKTSTRALLLLLTVASQAQVNTEKTEKQEKPFIEVEGIAELSVVPDEIVVRITLKERSEGREKISVEHQQQKLKDKLKTIGVNLKDFSLSDVHADFIRVRWLTNEVVTKKEYALKLSNAEKTAEVFSILDSIKVDDAYIAYSNHSKIDSLRKVVKIKAIKAAKNKADYLLEAIGEQCGKALVVRESAVRDDDEYDYKNKGGRAKVINEDKLFSSGKTEEIQFKKITIRASVYVKFGIK